MTETPDNTGADEPGSQLEEEPQSERGAEGSRDAESDLDTDRPADTADHDSDTGVDPQEPQDSDAPNLQAGGN